MKIRKDDTKIYFECNCGILEHVMRVTLFRWENWIDFIIETQFAPDKGFFRRLKFAFKYLIFNYPLQSSESILNIEQVKKLRNVCDEYLTDVERLNAR